MGLIDFCWHYGVNPASFPEISGKYNGNVVICGDAHRIWDDLEDFGCRSGNKVEKTGWDFFTVNRMVETFPGKIEHCYSNVGDVLNRFIRARRDEYLGEFGYPVHSHSRTTGSNHVWPWQGSGTSGLGAILTALALGYNRIVLCGMPLDNSGHNGEPHWRVSNIEKEALLDLEHWQRAINLAFEGKVRSMSGLTNVWLTSPD